MVTRFSQLSPARYQRFLLLFHPALCSRLSLVLNSDRLAFHRTNPETIEENVTFPEIGNNCCGDYFLKRELFFIYER